MAPLPSFQLPSPQLPSREADSILAAEQGSNLVVNLEFVVVVVAVQPVVVVEPVGCIFGWRTSPRKDWLLGGAG